MVAAKTTDDLLTEVRERAQLPDTDGRLSPEDNGASGILRIASDVYSTSLADLLVSLRQERWVTTGSVPIASGTAAYRVPYRALAAGVADILIVDSDGTEWSAPEIVAEDRWRYTDRRGPWRGPFGYTWEGDRVVLLPTPTASGCSLRVRYPRQPSRLVKVSACANISGIAGAVITTSASVPSTWTSSETVDIVEGTPHGDVLGSDLEGTSVSGTSITVASGLPSEATAGDYVCRAGETCIPALPESVWPVLVAETCLGVLKAIGDQEAVALAVDSLARATVHARNVLAPRNRGERRMLVARNSALRGGRFPGRRVR